MNAPDPMLTPAGESGESAAFLHGLGRRVREARERRGWSRKALSQQSHVSERYLAQLEAGDGNVSIVLLRRVAQSLDELKELVRA